MKAGTSSGSRSRRSSLAAKASDDAPVGGGLGVQALRPPTSSPAHLQNLRVACIGNLNEHVRCGCASKGFLFTGDNKGLVLQWNALDASSAKVADFSSAINALETVRDGLDLWAGLANGEIVACVVESKAVKSSWHAHLGGVTCFAVATTCVWSGGADFNIKKWDVEGRPLAQYGHHHTLIRHLLLVSGANPPPMVQLWSCSNEPSIAVTLQADDVTRNEPAEPKLLNGHEKAVFYMCRVGEGTVWSGSEDGSIRIWGIAEMSCKREVRAHKGPVSSIVTMGSHVWSASGDHTVNVWDDSHGQHLFTLGDQGGYVRAMVRLEWMMWVFAAEKNVKVWIAQSLWASYQSELENLVKQSLQSLQRAQLSENEVLRLKDAALREALSKEALEKQLRAETQSAREILQNERDLSVKRENAAIGAIKDAKEDRGSASAKRRASTDQKAKPGEENPKLMEEIAQLRDLLSDLNKDKDATGASLQQSGGEVARLKQELEQARKDNSDAQTRLEAAATDADSMKQNLQKNQGEVQQLKDETAKKLEDLQKALAQAQLENTAANARLRSQEELQNSSAEERGGLASENADLKNKIQELTSELVATKNKLELTSQDKVSSLEALQKVQEGSDASKQEAAEKAKQLVKQEATIKQLQEEMEKLKKLQSTTAIKKEKADKALADLKARMEETEGNIGTLKAKMAETAAAMQAVLAERDQLQLDLADAKSRLEQALKGLETTGQERDKEGSQVTKLTEELVKSNEENASLKERLKSLAEQSESSSSSASEDKSHLEEELAKRRENLAEALDKADRYAATVQELQDELTHMKQDSEQSASRLKESTEKLQGERDALQQRLEQLQKELEGRSSDRAALEGKVAALEKEIQDCQGELVKKDHEAESAKQIRSEESQALQEELAGLKDKCAKSEAASAQWAEARDTLTKELNNVKEAMAAEREGLIKELSDHKKALSTRTAELEAASRELASLQDKLRGLEADVERGKATTSDAAEAKAELASAQRQIRKLEDALAQAHEDYKRACAERSYLQADRTTNAVTIRALGVDIAQKVCNLYVAESCLHKALAKLEAANQKIKSLEEGYKAREAESGVKDNRRGNLLDYTRLKIVSGEPVNIAVVGNDPEVFVQKIESRLSSSGQSPSGSRSRTPLRIAEECCQMEQGESSRRAHKEKERFLSGRGLLRGPFP